MTELADVITVRITLHHDIDSSETRGKDLHSALRQYWQHLAPWVSEPDQKGKAELLGGAIKIEWEQSGMTEIPELGGSDN